MDQECPEGYSNVDELDLVDISDCHINKTNMKIMYAMNIIFAGILFTRSAFKVLPLLRTGQYFYDYLPHLCITSWCLHGAIMTVIFGYKLVAYAPYSSIDTICLLLHSISTLFGLTGTWIFIFYLMAISVFSEIGGKGAVMMKHFWGRAKVLCGCNIFWFFVCPLLALIRNVLIRLASHLMIAGCIFAALSVGSMLVYYAWKADSLLTHIIETLPLEDTNITTSSPGRKMAKIEALKKRRQTIRVVSIMFCGGIAPIGITLTLGCMFVPFVARESWLSFNALYMMTSLGGLAIVLLINSTPPSASSRGAGGSRLLFLPSSRGRRHTTVSVITKSQYRVTPTLSTGGRERGDATATFTPMSATLADHGDQGGEESGNVSVD